jgi:4-alpha-glucanotransferase
MGDMPIFISQDSADVWAHQQLFQLQEDGSPAVVAGVPPDYFSATGQLWGNPQYDWEAMQKEHYQWWKARFRKLYQLVDIVRVDHFRGFESYWEIDGKAKTAVNGRWVKGPGQAFFAEVERELGHLPLVAEDLGIITDEVEQLRDKCGYPGMKVLHFMMHFNDMHRMGAVTEENSIVYTGTHDNNTTVGWFNHDLDRASAASVAALLQVERRDAKSVCHKLIEYAYAEEARLAIIPVQDVLGLDEQSRMNTPGTVGINWKWCLKEGMLTEAQADWLQALCEKYQR